MQLISGKPIAERLLREATDQIRAGHLSPGLAVVMVGRDPASEIYVGLKEKAAERTGVHFEKHTLSSDVNTDIIQSLIRDLNGRPDIHGIIVQLPLPAAIDTDQVIASIDPQKDADGFHPETVHQFLSGETNTPPVFPRAILALLESTQQPLRGKRAFVFANSQLFAQVMKRTLQSVGVVMNSSIEVGKEEMMSRLHDYDIVITAKGDPHFLRGAMVRPGAIIIDGGITRVGESVKSDADAESFKDVPGYITPVPGGVGPVTVALLIRRVTELAGAMSDTERVY